MSIGDIKDRADYDLCEMLGQAGLTNKERLPYLVALAECVVFQIREETGV